MIIVRRALTVPLAGLLTLALVVTLFAHRANESVLSADFYTEQIAAIGVFDAIHDEVLPVALDDFLSEQEEKLPDNLAAIELPTDAASQALVLDLARTAFPPEYLEALSTDAIEAFVEYLTGARGDLDWSISLHDPVEAVFVADGTGATRFEAAWTDLDLATLAFQSLATAMETPELDAVQDEQARQVLAILRGGGVDTESATDFSARLFENAPVESQIPTLASAALSGSASVAQLAELEAALIAEGVEATEAQDFVALLGGTGAPPAESVMLTILLGDEREAAVEWFEGELFAAAREFAGYLSGQQETLDVRIDFSQFPELASIAAAPLNADPDELVRNGYQLTESSLQVELDDAEDPPFESLDELRAVFTVGGRTYGIADFQGGGAGSDGLSVDQVRAVAGPATRWAVPAGAVLVLVLAAIVGVLAGRAWWSRAVWAALPIASAAAAVAIVAGPIFGAVATPALETALADTRADLVADDSPYSPLGLRALDQLEVAVNAQAGALATNAAVIAILALLVIAAAAGWHWYSTRRTSEDSEDAAPPEPIALPANEDGKERARAA